MRYIGEKMNLIFDIGANIGQFAQRCLEQKQGCKVICVEPNLELTVKLNDRFAAENVEVLDCLVSTNNDEEIDFYISNADTISTANLDWINNSRFSHSHIWYQPIKKKTINIDKLIELYGNPDLIKIDVENYELEVIRGLSSKQKKICFEWAEETFDKTHEVCLYLKKLGYNEFGYLNDDEYLKEPEVYTELEKMDLYDDIVKERKSRFGMIWVK